MSSDTRTERGTLPGPSEVASYLGVPVKTLSQWRYLRVGPPWFKVGKAVRYRWSDVDAWLQASARGTG